MRLRSRLLVGYWYLVALLIVAATTATFGFLHLSVGIEAVLEENVKTMRAGMRMIEALERQDSATLAGLVGDQPSVAELETLDAEFLAALDQARANVTEVEEQPVITALAEGFERYRSARDGLLGGRDGRGVIEYRQTVFPRFLELKGQILELVEINQRAMVEADRRARGTALSNAVWLGILVGVAMLSLVWLSRILQRHFLTRLSGLERGMAAIAEGEASRRLSEGGRDELTLIARQFNRLLDQRQQAAAAFDARLARERRLLLAVLRSVGDDAEVYDLSGSLLAAASSPLRSRPEVASWIVGRGRELLATWEASPEGAPPEGEVVELEQGDRAELRLIVAGSAPPHPVAWLAAMRPATG